MYLIGVEDVGKVGDGVGVERMASAVVGEKAGCRERHKHRRLFAGVALGDREYLRHLPGVALRVRKRPPVASCLFAVEACLDDRETGGRL